MDLAIQLGVFDKTAESILSKDDEAYWIRLAEMATLDSLAVKFHSSSKEPYVLHYY